MKAMVIVLTVVATLLGAASGAIVGFAWTLKAHIQTDMKLSCALLQTAQTARYLTRERRGQLVDKVVPALSKGAPLRPGANVARRFADVWWDSIREDQKSGCSGT
jgi:hypothetical protein